MLNAVLTSQHAEATRRGCPFTGKPERIGKATAVWGNLRGPQAADETSTVYFQSPSPCNHMLSRATSQLLSVSGVVSSFLEGKGLFPWKGCTRTESYFQTKEKLSRKRARDS